MNIEPIRLRRGSGNGDPRDGVCLMQAVHWFSGADNLSDHPECASPVLCAVGIRLNDLAPDQSARNQLWPLVWQLLDSRDPEAEQIRAQHIVREVTHRIVASLFGSFASSHAAALRTANSMSVIEASAWAAAMAAARAAAAMAAEAAAMAAAEAAARAAGAEAAARAAGAEAAEAAARAAAAAAAAAEEEEEAVRMATWNELRLIFIEAIALGKHGEADPIYEQRAAQLIRILELAK